MRFNYSVSGIASIQAKIRNLENIEDKVKPIVSKNIAEMHNRAGSLTPKDTGELLNSAFVTLNGLEGWFGYSKEYAPFVEFGHRRVRKGKTIGWQPAQPFLRPNLEAQAPIFKSDLERLVESLIR